MIEFWLAETTETFWNMAGGYSPDFEFVVTCALPLSIERIAGLSVSTAYRWLIRHGFEVKNESTESNRFLRGCLIALGDDRNFVLLDDNDVIDEQRFSLAHEVAHFLLDYCQPRQEIQHKLGLLALEVIDGQRLASLEERLQGALAGISLQPYHHFMERNSVGDILSSSVLASENRADRLALELLAPEEVALPMVKTVIKGLPNYTARRDIACTMLAENFGLPQAIARLYAQQLVTVAGGDQTFMEWLHS